MNLFNSKPTLLATVVLSCFLGACATTPDQIDLRAEQNAAIQRWVNCVDWQAELGDASATMVRVSQYCDGHKRDLLATYPAHLENQLSAVLMARSRVRAARELVQEGTDTTAIPVSFNR